MFTVSIITGVALAIAIRASLNQRRRTKAIADALTTRTATPQFATRGAKR